MQVNDPSIAVTPLRLKWFRASAGRFQDLRAMVKIMKSDSYLAGEIDQRKREGPQRGHKQDRDTVLVRDVKLAHTNATMISSAVMIAHTVA